MTYEIMYIEEKEDVAALEARIGKVTFSKSGKTLSYNGQKFQSLKGAGWKANYFDLDTGESYWISKCRKDGNDALYQLRIHVDEDIRAEYWTKIRKMPERSSQESFLSKGKYTAGGKTPKHHKNNT